VANENVAHSTHAARQFCFYKFNKFGMCLFCYSGPFSSVRTLN